MAYEDYCVGFVGTNEPGEISEGELYRGIRYAGPQFIFGPVQDKGGLKMNESGPGNSMAIRRHGKFVALEEGVVNELSPRERERER